MTPFEDAAEVSRPRRPAPSVESQRPGGFRFERKTASGELGGDPGAVIIEEPTMSRPRSSGAENARLENLPFAQVPHIAMTVSTNAYKTLGALAMLAKTTLRCEATDHELAQIVRGRLRAGKLPIVCSRQTIQRALSELESAGLIERRRRYGRRMIILLYTLSGIETSKGRERYEDREGLVHACIKNGTLPSPLPTVHACTTDGTRMSQPGHMHVPPTVLPLKKQENKEQQQHGSAVENVVVALSAPPEDPEDTAELDDECVCGDEPDWDGTSVPERIGFLSGLAGDLAVVMSQGDVDATTPQGRTLAVNPGASEDRESSNKDTTESAHSSRANPRTEHNQYY